MVAYLVLFISSICEPLIRKLKTSCEPDGFLSWLHVLMMTDDTLILATSRERCVHKLSLLFDYCSDASMVINESKTKFIVICGDDTDRMPFVLNDITIKNCEQYVYLGSVFTQDGKLGTVLE